MLPFNLITILGPTATGKTSFGARLAFHLGGEIISADSRQVYRQMTIGTGKDYDDYQVMGTAIPVHLIDIHDPGYKYNVYEYQQDFNTSFKDITQRDRIPLLVGGTGMYIQAVLDRYHLISVPLNEDLRRDLEDKSQSELVALLKEYDASLHNTTDILYRKRTLRAIEIAEYYRDHADEKSILPEIRAVILGIRYDREIRRKRISERLKTRLKQGMIEEVKELLKTTDPEDLLFYGLEYKYITLYLRGELNYNEMFCQLEIAIHQFAKRQMTWFRRMERQGFDIQWIDGHLEMDEKIYKAYQIIKERDQQLIEQWQTLPE